MIKIHRVYEKCANLVTLIPEYVQIGIKYKAVSIM